ncbi:DUF2252 domain-containing protein [Flavitalea flava]
MSTESASLLAIESAVHTDLPVNADLSIHTDLSVTERINAFNSGREEEMIQVKLEAMEESLFRFYRGTCHLFYEDLANALAGDLANAHGGNRANIHPPLPASPAAWICGDLHLENFGSFKSDNRLVYFDLNDFDEAVLAPALYEVARMTTSIFLAFESLGIELEKAEKMSALYVKSYATCLKGGKPNYIEPQTAQGIVCEFLTAANHQRLKDILVKRTIREKKKLKILLDHPRHIKLEKSFRKELVAHMETWLRQDGNSPYNYKILDSAFRIAGTGSLGLKRYVLLMQSLNEAGEKFMLIDMKQAVKSSVLPFTPLAQPQWLTQADRIKEVQARMQNRPPALLSTTHFKGDVFIIQEMQPEKDSINFKLLKERYRDMYRVIEDMGMLTASAQLRSAGRQGSAITDELMDFGSDEAWQERVLDYSRQYASTIRKYYQEFVDFRKAG